MLADCSPAITNRDSRAFSVPAAPAVGADVVISTVNLALAGATETSAVPLATISGSRTAPGCGDTGTCACTPNATRAAPNPAHITAVRLLQGRCFIFTFLSPRYWAVRIVMARQAVRCSLVASHILRQNCSTFWLIAPFGKSDD